jgi:hypothetical protein
MERESIHGGMQLIRDALTEAGFRGLFSVQPHERITMKGHVKFRVTIHRGEHFIVNCKPGDNGTAWEWWIRPPHPLTAEHCHRILTALQPVDDASNGHATKPRFTTPPAIEDPSKPNKATVLAADHPEEDGMSRLVARLATAGSRAKAYKAREDLMAKAKAAFDEAEMVLLEAQETHDRLKQVYTACRNEHLSDAKGKEAAAFMDTLKGLE